MNKLTIGIDFGGVLSINDTSNNIHRNVTIDMPYAKEALFELSKTCRLFLVSHCGKQRAIQTKESLIVSGLADYFSGLYFVKKPEYKSQITKYLECDIMIDDTKSVLENIISSDDKIVPILFTNNWNEIIKMIHNICKKEKNKYEITDINKYCYIL
jgi:hypothetical protein